MTDWKPCMRAVRTVMWELHTNKYDYYIILCEDGHFNLTHRENEILIKQQFDSLEDAMKGAK